jgi:tRNA1Val (adenine37-N6)-methyltransferase
MPWRVAEYLSSQGYDFRAKQVLDLCAGCGVIGFEFHFHRPEIGQIDFVEVQEVYSGFFSDNAEKVRNGPQAGSDTRFQFLNLNYSQLAASEFSERYDLILSNPPYFEMDQGKLSPNQFKNRCRFYIDSDFSTLISATLNAMKPEGLAFFLIRPLSEHKKNLLVLLEALIASQGEVQVIDLIRGTSLVSIKKTV